jgi:hypothetical protein
MRRMLTLMSPSDEQTCSMCAITLDLLGRLLGNDTAVDTQGDRIGNNIRIDAAADKAHYQCRMIDSGNVRVRLFVGFA